jgi:hypothetical protein
MSYFDRINQDRARRVTNVLVEAPFFYRDDDEDLFLFLRRNRAAFQRFFDDCFGWELVVESRCARVLKTSWHNPALKPSQHDVFNLTRRDDCVAFLLVLEFYEHLLEEQNLSIDDPDPPRFYFGSLFEFARERFTEELGEATPEDASVRKTLRRVVEILLRYRFLRELRPDPSCARSWSPSAARAPSSLARPGGATPRRPRLPRQRPSTTAPRARSPRPPATSNAPGSRRSAGPTRSRRFAGARRRPRGSTGSAPRWPRSRGPASRLGRSTMCSSRSREQRRSAWPGSRAWPATPRWPR